MKTLEQWHIPGTIACWNACKEKKPHPLWNVHWPLPEPFSFYWCFSPQDFTCLTRIWRNKIVWGLYAKLKTSLANHSRFKCATLLFEGFRSSLGCAWVLLPGFIGFCWILGGTSKQQNPPPCPFRLGSKTVHGFTFKFRPVIVPLRWINRIHLLRLISTTSIASASFHKHIAEYGR